MSDTAAVETDAAPSWTDGLSEDQVGFVEMKNWGGPGDALTSYQQLEKLVGKDPGRVITIPNPDASPEEWTAIHEKLGRPNDATGYALPEIEGANEAQDARIREEAFALDLTPAQAAKMQARVYENVNAALATRQAEAAKAVGKTAAVLRSEWGANYDANNEYAADGVLFIGGEGFMKTVEAKGLLADPNFVKAMAKIGELQAEPDGLVGGKEATSFEMSPGQAKANIGAATMDKAFNDALFDKRHPGHKAAVEKQTRLFQAAHPS